MRRRHFVQLTLGTMAGLWASGCGGDSSATFSSGPTGSSGNNLSARVQTSEDFLFESDGRSRVFQLDPYRGRILVQDTQGAPQLELTGATNPYSLGVAGDTKIYVLDRGQADIAVFSSRGVLERRIAAGLLEGAFQMAVGQQELYLLSAVAGAVLVFDLNGQLLRRIPLADRVFFRDIALGPTGDLHLLQATPPLVQVLNSQGAPLRSYGPGPATSGRSLSVDAQGRSLIVDAIGGSIHLFDAGGNFIQSISQTGLQPLQALANQDGSLFVLVQETT